MKNPRSRAREEVLKRLYQLDILKETPEIDEEEDLFSDKQLKKEACSYANLLFKGCVRKNLKIDGLIEEGLNNWKFSRVSAIDRCILRIGVFEILFNEEIPSKVAINEAIELAKKYSSEKAGGFVNGLLDNIRKNNQEE